jgi:hypothetical protein
MQKSYIAAGVLAAMEQPPEQHACSFRSTAKHRGRDDLYVKAELFSSRPVNTEVQ